PAARRPLRRQRSVADGAATGTRAGRRWRPLCRRPGPDADRPQQSPTVAKRLVRDSRSDADGFAEPDASAWRERRRLAPAAEAAQEPRRHAIGQRRAALEQSKVRHDAIPSAERSGAALEQPDLY